MGRVRRSIFALLFLTACGGGGCPSGAGNYCDPNQEDCQYGYYCSRIGVCTKQCATIDDCKAGRTCSADTQCLAGEACIDGLCGEPVECIDGYCQLPCAKTSTCTYDPYGPWSRSGDDD